MSAKRKIINISTRRLKIIFIFLLCCLFFLPVIAATTTSFMASQVTPESFKKKPSSKPYFNPLAIAQQLGWVESPINSCGGYYLEQPFPIPLKGAQDQSVILTSESGLLSQRATSILEGRVTANRYGQQMTSNKAFVYRNPSTGQLSAMDMIGNVHFREPNTLVIGKIGSYNFSTKAKALTNILYRTSLQNGTKQILGPEISLEQMKTERRITALTAWGQGDEFWQTEPKIYELAGATYSTCPPTKPAWQVKASHIVLNKITGRGYATHARILVHNVPIFYTPYINFSIDRRRKSGFLWPTLGSSNKWGPYLLTPFYWNMAPNYDMTITPGILTKRGLQLTDRFRYLTKLNNGEVNVSVLPNDKYFANFQKTSAQKFANSTDKTTQAELNRLLTDSTTRKSLFWRDESRFDKHWSSHVDFNYASDDYYLRDFGSNLNEITQNQLLQEADLYYKSQHWDFTGRLQAYQTLHPVDEPPVNNAYRRFPQLILNGDYPDQRFGLEYFIQNELTHFDIRNTPGIQANLPIGNRVHTQPGISWPLSSPYYYFTPRLQFAFTQYQLYQTAPTNTPGSKRRALPIFDTALKFYFSRDLSLFNQPYQQTLEPQFYYTYIPYRSQNSIPIFDTIVNTLTYDQLFNYNRFSGIDRIGDANQIALGFTTRLIESETGLEKLRFGLGGIIYFAPRRVTLCNNNSCADNPNNPELSRKISPLSGTLSYSVNASWKLDANTIWNPIDKQLDNATINFQYQPIAQHIINFGYTYARTATYSGVSTTDASDNLKASTISFAWPLLHEVSVIGLWTQNWNQGHLQNLLYGLQYDTCCWAVRFVGGRSFTGFESNNNNTPNPTKPQYNNQYYIQFSLKGLGDLSSGNPSGVLSSINGYNTQFGQETS